MKTTRLFCLLALLGTLGSDIHAAPLGTAFTYQGQLTDGGQPANGIYDLRFAIYDAAGGGSAIAGPITNSAAGVSNGLFMVTLDFGPAVFTGDARWLEIAVRTNGGAAAFTPLAPRQALTATPYALFAPSAGAAGNAATAASAAAVSASGVANASLQPNAVTSDKIADGTIAAADVSAASFNTTFWRATGNAGTTTGTHFLGTTDNRPLELKVNGARALRLEYASNVFGVLPNVIGGAPANSVGTGVVAATIGGGGEYAEGHRITDHFSTIAGGRRHLIEGFGGAIGGGQGIRILTNTAYSTVAGGWGILVDANASYAAIAGGSHHWVQTNADYAAVGGGFGHRIGTNTMAATIAGGSENVIESTAGNAAIGGGWNNRIGSNSWNATIGGGAGNQVTRENATIAGGVNNLASEQSATVGGGDQNVASGWRSTVPGGFSNIAAGNFSFAAGRRAKAGHEGAFVWADSQDADFASTAANQFLIRAAGGVGIGTTNPVALLDVAGPARVGALHVTSAAIVTNLNAALLDGLGSSDYWRLGGNRFTDPAAQFLGVTNNQPLDIRVNNLRALRLEPHDTSPNVIGGFSGNIVGPGCYGSTIGGGGHFNRSNLVFANYATIAGGDFNQIGHDADGGAIGGGTANMIAQNSRAASIAGGSANDIATECSYAAIGGGTGNHIGNNSRRAVIAGGNGNDIGSNSLCGAIGGGQNNQIAGGSLYATIGGVSTTASAPIPVSAPLAAAQTTRSRAARALPPSRGASTTTSARTPLTARLAGAYETPTRPTPSTPPFQAA